MFEAFQQKFTPDLNALPDAVDAPPDLEILGLGELIARFGGASFNGGLYRIIRASDLSAWNARVSFGFPEFAESVTCFGYDWLGRAFAADGERRERVSLPSSCSSPALARSLMCLPISRRSTTLS